MGAVSKLEGPIKEEEEKRGGGLWAKNTRSHGEVILPPARTHSWTTTVESKSSECTKWKENELNREEEEERFVDFLEP